MNISFDFDRTEIDRFFFYWKNLGISEKKKKKKTWPFSWTLYLS